MTKLSSYVLPCKSYTKIGEDMSWPSYNQDDLEWQLRYGSEEQVVADRFRLASIVSAYHELIGMTQARRNEICSALRDAKPSSESGEVGDE